jgi:linoleate 8R-lipoxygenase/9,12-octadecadienoate 8-hydroperoxide 8R-isomerase
MFNIPIKTDKTPRGLVTEQQLFEGLGVIFTYLFFNGDEATGLWLKSAAFMAYKKLADLLKLNINKIKAEGKLRETRGHKEGEGFLQLYGDNLIRKMLKDEYSVDDVVTLILLTAAGVANFGPIVFHLCRLFLL